MKRCGRERREALVDLARAAIQPDDIVVDVGADHGHVAATLGAFATERAPGRVGRPDVRWVIADGLRPFRRVDVAIIAGMGWRTIRSILGEGCRPRAAVVHCPDDPPALRAALASDGWCIVAEDLAWEGRRYAEVIRVSDGAEPSTGARLALGPRLLEAGHPLLRDHLERVSAELRGLLAVVRDPQRRSILTDRLTLAEVTLSRGR